MKKSILFLVAFISLSIIVHAQAYEGTTQYAKKKQQAILCDYSYSTDAVQNAFVAKLAKLGYKPKEVKGIFNRDRGTLVFKNTVISDISNDRMDYILSVETKSRKDKDASTLYLIINKDDDNIFNKNELYTINNAKAFLNNLLPDVQASDLELKIKDQEDVVAKAEKKLRDLKDTQSSLEKKLDQNKSDQQSTQKDIEAQKQALGVLIGQRKSN